MDVVAKQAFSSLKDSNGEITEAKFVAWFLAFVNTTLAAQKRKAAQTAAPVAKKTKREPTPAPVTPSAPAAPAMSFPPAPVAPNRLINQTKQIKPKLTKANPTKTPKPSNVTKPTKTATPRTAAVASTAASRGAAAPVAPIVPDAGCVLPDAEECSCKAEGSVFVMYRDVIPVCPRHSVLSHLVCVTSPFPLLVELSPC